MKVYTVYLKANDELVNALFIPEAEFSIAAFLFNAIWMIYHRMWQLGALFVLIYGVISVVKIGQYLPAPVLQAVGSGLSLFVGFFAYDLYRYHLRRKGFTLRDVIVADNLEKAQLQFFSKHI
jgi:uncharacterized membrane protein